MTLGRVLLGSGVALVCVLGAASARGETRASPASQRQITVYLVRAEHISPVRRTVPVTVGVARAALVALLRAPSARERAAGYSTAIPGGTTLRTVTVARGFATVDLSARFQAGGGSTSMLLRVAQVVHTATQFSSVHRVAFRLDGRPIVAIGGEGVIVSPPVGRAAFEAQAPPILVEQPLPGDTVRGTIVVRGTANVFEARLVVELRAGGVVLARKLVSASAGTGTRGTFSTRIATRAPARPLTVVVYSRSPKDGAQINVVRVPIAR